MKKIISGIIVIVMAVAMLFTFTACNKYKWEAVGGMEDASKAVENNGSLVVKQGNYLYHVNGVDSTTLTSANDNKWGNASVKGSIMKSKIKEDGSLECLGVVIPKTFYSGYSGAGLYIYGQWIYYPTRTIKTDNAGTVLSGIEYLRTTLDGTKTQSIADIENASSEYIFTPNGLLYTNENNIHFVPYNDSKVEKDKTVVEEYASITVSKEENAMFYVKASKNTLVAGQNLGMVNAKGENKVLIKEDSYYAGEGKYYEDLATQFELKILSFKDKALYYTKTCVDAESKAGTYAYNFAEGFSFDKTKEIKFADTALTTIYPLGLNKGVLEVSSADVKLYKQMTTEEVVSDKVTFAAAISIAFIDGGYVYYTQGGALYRANLINGESSFNKAAYEEKILTNSIGSTYGAPQLLGGYVYFEDTTASSYVHRFKLADYSISDGKVVNPKAYIVSGYKQYEYAKDADFVINKEDEVIKDLVPKYMATKDLDSYIETHKTANEE